MASRPAAPGEAFAEARLGGQSPPPAPPPPQREGRTLREPPAPTSGTHFPPHHPLLTAKRWAPGTRVLLFFFSAWHLPSPPPLPPTSQKPRSRTRGRGPGRAPPGLRQRAQGRGEDAQPQTTRMPIPARCPRRLSPPVPPVPVLLPGSAPLSPAPSSSGARARRSSAQHFASNFARLPGAAGRGMLMRERGPARRASRLLSRDWLRRGGRMTLCK